MGYFFGFSKPLTSAKALPRETKLDKRVRQLPKQFRFRQKFWLILAVTNTAADSWFLAETRPKPKPKPNFRSDTIENILSF